MVFRFTVVSDESDEFLREIMIDADDTFLDFCLAILKSCRYSDSQMTSFVVTDDEGDKKCEVTREDMGVSFYDEDIYTMDKTSLRSLLDDTPMHLKFIFDTFNNRAFDVEFKEMIPGKSLESAKTTRSIGDAPDEIVLEETPVKKNKKAQPGNEDFTGENFYGSDGFDDEELGNEGLGISETPFGGDDDVKY